ncbi:MAG: DUF72 domain-containing protein [Polyangiaceae bacterium]|nr:DUF72 domain-containing protein [Polyangiaceae bacterium]
MKRASVPRLPEPDPERARDAEALAARAPLPAMQGNVSFGTAGWTDKTLLSSGAFYPKKSLRAAERLRFYAEHFRLVEVDATYYTLVGRDTTGAWAEHTPEDFTFDVKAHPVLTGHPIEVARLPLDLRAALPAGRVYPDALPSGVAREIEERFVAALEPLSAAGKLGAVFLQYPPWFAATRGNARRIAAVRERHPSLPFAVEFRHPSWLAPDRRERLTTLLGDNEMSYVVVDEPVTEHAGVPSDAWVTCSLLAVVRFHGHNVAGFGKRGASVHERFDWLYTEGELRPWVPRIRALAREAKRVHVVFNNCVRNYAVLGAKGLSVLLEEA